MFKTKALVRLTFLSALVAWIILAFSDLMVLYSDMRALPSDLPHWLPRFMLDLYIIALFYYYKFKIERDENLNFTDLLWKVFATGLIATIVSLSLRLIIFLIGTGKLTNNVLFLDFVYQINLALFINFLLAAYTSWKRLILYQKTKWLMRAWLLFELLLLGILIYDSIHFSISLAFTNVVIVLISLLGLVLSANMRWVAYLNFKQKWTSLLLLLLTIFYLIYFLYSILISSDAIVEQTQSFVRFQEHVFNIALMAFVLTYITFSFLVILFNLPTSSVFEQKLEEVVNFQRISQSIQTEQSEESVYNILLESSVNSVFADAAWLEMRLSNNEHKVFTYKITEGETNAIKEHLEKNNIKGVLDQSSDKTKNLSKHLSNLKNARFR